MEENTVILHNILVAEILQLAKQLKEEKRSKGVTSTSDFVREAVDLIRHERTRILELMR